MELIKYTVTVILQIPSELAMHRSVLIAAICVDLEQGGVGRADLPFGARYGLNSDIELSPKSAKAPFWLVARYFRSTPDKQTFVARSACLKRATTRHCPR